MKYSIFTKFVAIVLCAVSLVVCAAGGAGIYMAEQNGLYTYDRKAKFDPAIFHAILSQKAAIEEDEK